MIIDVFIFFIKEKKVFMKYMESLEKVSNVIKSKFNSELAYSKKHVKAEKNYKWRLAMFICASNIE